ncbi:HMG1/2-like protein [Hordeum vulgare]|nr:HMG1/2-like protein [Hordeum vulgare]
MALYLLFESAFGYALFHAYGIDEIGQSVDAIRSTVLDLKRFSKAFKLASFTPFLSAVDALNQCNAISEGIMTNELRNFLELNLPKVKEGKKAKFKVSVMEPKVGSHITEATRIPCESNDYIQELLRAVRLHFDQFIEQLKLVVHKSKVQKDPNKPKQPPSSFLVFMDTFRKEYKEKNPNVKQVSMIGKAAGEK